MSEQIGNQRREFSHAVSAEIECSSDLQSAETHCVVPEGELESGIFLLVRYPHALLQAFEFTAQLLTCFPQVLDELRLSCALLI
jgi:hypothetical protein